MMFMDDDANGWDQTGDEEDKPVTDDDDDKDEDEDDDDDEDEKEEEEAV